MKTHLNFKLTTICSILFIITFTATFSALHWFAGYFSKVSENTTFSYSYTVPSSHAYSYDLPKNTNPVWVIQGDPILIDINITEKGEVMSGLCTAGYIDKSSRTLYTAGHCFNGIQQPSKTIVYTQNRQPIGYLDDNNGKNLRKHKPNDNTTILGNDWGKIHLYDNVFVANPISGDGIINAHKDAKVGEELCYFSRKNEKIFCSHIMKIKDNVIVTGNKENSTIHGDSGGPAWIPQRGFVGVISTGTYNNNNTDSSHQSIGINIVESPYINHEAKIDTYKTMTYYQIKHAIKHLCYSSVSKLFL